MSNLFLAELQRFRVWALLALLAHLAVLGFFARMIDPLQQPVFVYQVVAAVYGLAGLLLGLYQMGGYRRPNTWLNLLHRPIPQRAIVTALAGAAMLLLAIAVLLPLLIVIAAQSALTARVVDLRHWGLPLAAWAIACACYLGAAGAMLAPRRLALFPLVPITVLMFSAASGFWVLLLQALLLAWLAALLAALFKPDLSAPPRTPIGEVLLAIPMQFGIWMFLVTLTLVYQTGWMLLGTHPLNSTPPVGGYVEASRADGADLLLAGLERSDHAQAALWREQVRLSEVHGTEVQIEEFARRHQLTNPMPMEFDDDGRRTRYIYSHDDMRFHGVALADGRRSTVLGVGSEHRAFDLPPLPLGASALATANTVYAYDDESGQIEPRIALLPGETLAALPAPAGESMTLLSDRALYFFDARSLANGAGVPAPRTRVPLPGAIGSLDRVDLIELLDGHLLSFVYGRGSTDGAGESYQQLLKVDGEGRIEPVARRELAPDFPLWLRYYDWWLSPAMHGVRSVLANLFADPAPLKLRDPAPRPASMQILAAALMLASLLAALWLSRRQGLHGARRWLWVAGCGAVGLPALIALRLLHTDRDAPVPACAANQRMSAIHEHV
jgi:hypothetical protein